MITTEHIDALVKASEDNPALLKDLKNINMFKYYMDKYYHVDDMIRDYYPELLKQYLPWSIDMHCYDLYRRKAETLEGLGLTGKALVLQTLAESHRDVLLWDLGAIHDHLDINLDFWEEAKQWG